MSHKLRVLLLVVLSAPICRAFQIARFAQVQEIHPTAESKTAQDQAFNARKRLLLAAENAQQLKIAASNSHTPADQAKAAAAQQQVADAKKTLKLLTRRQRKSNPRPSHRKTGTKYRLPCRPRAVIMKAK